MSKIQSLARGLVILDLLAQAENGMGTVEFAQHLGIDKSSASRLLHTLASHGYVEQDPDTRRYKLGPHVITLSRSVLNRMPLRDEARPYLLHLTQLTGECSHLAILSQGRALYVDQVESPSILRVETEVGTLSPLHCTALGKVLLAHTPAALPTELPTHTPRTITAEDTLHMHLKEVRRQGYATDDEEHVLGVRCVAAPVYSYAGRVVGAIGISGPSGRVTLENLPALTQQVIETANELSRRLGGSST